MRVVITGASSGIGEALARHYASPGVVLGLISRREAVVGLPGTVVSYPLDVTDAAALEQAAADFVRRFGAPDLVIANAGVGVGTLGEDLADIAKLRRVLEVNVTGLAATLRRVYAFNEKSGARNARRHCQRRRLPRARRKRRLLRLQGGRDHVDGKPAGRSSTERGSRWCASAPATSIRR